MDLSFDGVLKIRVHNQPLTGMFVYDNDLANKCRSGEVLIGESRHGFIKYDFEKRPISL
jgi:hypothetical protein